MGIIPSFRKHLLVHHLVILYILTFKKELPVSVVQAIKRRLYTILTSRKFLIPASTIVGLFILMNYLIMPWYVNHGETLHVPAVVGMELTQAKAMLEDRGLIPIEAERRPDPKTPAGAIVSQNPEADAVVKNGRHVYLTISGGEVQVVVPSLRGRSEREAKFTLERAGLKLGNIDYATSDAYPENTIIEQSIQPGLKVAKTTPVRIVVSRGKELQAVNVPDFTGKTLSEVERLVAQQGLKVGNITYQASFDLVPNTVVDQFPRGGESVPGGQAIDLFVVKAGKPKEEIQIPRK
jgi:serine/threonine-protein kinase